jgi:TP901 family phage tail tape measure protein
MPLDGGVAIVRVVADASKLNQTILQSTRGATSGISGLGAKISGALSNPFVVAGAVVAGVTAKMGYDFEDAFTRIDAISNASSKDIALWREQVMTLGAETAQSPKDLADALYFLASAGLKANEVFPALEASAKASAVGLGSVAQVGSVVAAVLNAYAGSGLRASDVTDTLFAAVRESRAETDEFGQTLGRLLPISSRAGISFGELAGSLASLSNIGLDVYEASTAMRAAIQAITAPGEKAANTMNEMGISAQEMLDAIHEQGLLGALKYLDKQIKLNTSSESEYLRAFRDIVPNVRALTGVLGLTGANLKHVQSIFEATTNATGDLAAGLEVVQAGPAFKFREALTKLVITGTQLGMHVLPAITDLLSVLGPILEVVARNAKALLLAFLGYRALMFLPTLLGGIATALGLLGLGGGAGAAAGAAAGVYKFGQAAKYMGTTAAAANSALGAGAAGAGGAGFLAALAKVTPAGVKAAAGMFAIAYAIGDVSAQADTSKTRLEDVNNRLKLIANLQNNLQAGRFKGGALADQAGPLAETREEIQATIDQLMILPDSLQANAQAFQLAAKYGYEYSDALYIVNSNGMEGAQHSRQVTKSIRQQIRAFKDGKDAVNEAIPVYMQWGFATREAFGKFQEAIQETLQTGIGEFEKFEDAFAPASVIKKQLELAIRISRQKVNDLKEIFADDSLNRSTKLMLASLPADVRHIWAVSDDAGKAEILKLGRNWTRLQNTNVGKIMNPLKGMKDKAKTHGRAVPEGVRAGIVEGTPAAVAAARSLANKINNVMATIWKVASPSKVTHQFGAWLIEGLINGIKSREAALTNTIEHVTDVLMKQLDKAREALQQAKDDKKALAPFEAAVEVARGRVKMAHELEKMANQAQKALDKIISKFKEFKSSIRDGFSDFKDLGGIISDALKQYQDDLKQYNEDMIQYQEALADYMLQVHQPGDKPPEAPTAPLPPDYANIIAQTVANAQRLAKDLILAAKAGLSKALLAQFAAQGEAGANALEALLANPALIAQLNAAYQTINAAANNTAEALGAKFFGKAIREATHEFNNAVHALQKFIIAMIKAMIDVGGASAALKGLLANLQQQLQNAGNAGNAGGGGGGGGGGGNAPGPGNNWGSGWGGNMPGVPNAPPWQPTWKPTWEPTWEPSWKPKGDVYVTVNGDVTGKEVVNKVRDELIRIGRNNGGTGL